MYYSGCVNQVFVLGYRQRCKRRTDLHGFVRKHDTPSKRERGLDSEILSVCAEAVTEDFMTEIFHLKLSVIVYEAV